MAEKVRTATIVRRYPWGVDRWAVAMAITLSALTVMLVALALFAP
jgi:hypothetical protein